MKFIKTTLATVAIGLITQACSQTEMNKTDVTPPPVYKDLGTLDSQADQYSFEYYNADEGRTLQVDVNLENGDVIISHNDQCQNLLQLDNSETKEIRDGLQRIHICKKEIPQHGGGYGGIGAPVTTSSTKNPLQSATTLIELLRPVEPKEPSPPETPIGPMPPCLTGATCLPVPLPYPVPNPTPIPMPYPYPTGCEVYPPPQSEEAVCWMPAYQPTTARSFIRTEKSALIFDYCRVTLPCKEEELEVINNIVKKKLPKSFHACPQLQE